VAAVVFISLRNRGDEAWVRHSLTVRSNLLGVVGAVRDAESAQRGYLLTERNLYLAPYTEAVEAIAQSLDQLSVLVSDNSQQSQELAQLRRLATEKLDELRSTIEEDAAGHRDAALSILNNDKGFQLMQGIHQSVALMLAEEDRLLASRQLHAAWSSTLLLVGCAIALLAIFVLAFLISHSTRRSVAAIVAPATNSQSAMRNWLNRSANMSGSKDSSGSRKRWKPLGNSPEASRTISTTCSG
jgi:CHASE3 domain sensor protein